MSTDVVLDPSISAAHSVTPPLPDDPVVLKRMIQELLDALQKEQREREGLQQRLDQLLRRLYGPKAERFDPNQPWLLPELSNTDANEATSAPTLLADSDATTAAKPKRPGHGRKKLPDDLPRRRIEHSLSEPERLCPCCVSVR